MNATPHTYRLSATRGIWRVTLDGRFYGDYSAKGHALEAIAEARRIKEASGERVNVVIDNGDARA